jgi:5-methylcytosine-specific restriction protein A
MPERAGQYRPTQRPTGRTPDRRPSRHERGYDSRWSKFAKHYLALHPLCVLCAGKGITTAATCVDHIDGKGPLGPLGYEESNLRALCTRCHNSRTARDGHTKRKASQ